jgi:hypothetical protein
LGGAAEVDVEVAGDRRRRIAAALNTYFCSQCRLDEFLLHAFFGVFRRYRSEAEIQTETLPQSTG